MEELKTILKINITNWVLENFGESEVEDPSWNIDALAEHLAKHGYELYHSMEKRYLKEDFERVAEDIGVDPTDKQCRVAVNNYMESDDYGVLDRESVEYYIKQVMKGE